MISGAMAATGLRDEWEEKDELLSFLQQLAPLE